MADVSPVARTWCFSTEQQTLDFASKLSVLLQPGRLITLRGPLGAGKTALARQMLQTLMNERAVAVEPVPSPTFALVFSYDLGPLTVHHFDLYRVGDPGELELIGIRDYFDSSSCCLIEWPERGRGVLPIADIDIKISVGEGAESAGANPRQIQLELRQEQPELMALIDSPDSLRIAKEE